MVRRFVPATCIRLGSSPQCLDGNRITS
jgi:hypothetical protein